MAEPRRADLKRRTLSERGTLHPAPEKVQDPLFVDSEFFDPRDIVQVKYEMLRSVHAEGRTVADASLRFGLARPSFYKARRDFDHDGLPGLLPHKRGPHGPHKLTGAILDFVNQLQRQESTLKPSVLAAKVEERFGCHVHPRTIERAQRRGEKKR